MMIKAGIIGGTGYTGVELLRLLALHPQVDVAAISSRSESGRPVVDLFPSLRGQYDLVFSDPAAIDFSQLDVVFFATPHGVAQASMAGILAQGVKVVDLSADFRIRDVQLWEQWYGQPHQSPELIDQAVYGLPETHRAQIQSAKLVACPGCYPTSAQLGLKPLLEKPGLIQLDSIVINAASGATGAGRQASMGTIFSEIHDSVHAYKVDGHRHQPEIEQALSDIAGEAVGITFVPHLLPINRGIHTTIYADVAAEGAGLTELALQELYEDSYANEPFVDVLPRGQQASTRSVRGSNYCRMAVHRPLNRNKIVITVVEDNIVKGASGQAVQNMNIMFGCDETLGLTAPAVAP